MCLITLALGVHPNYPLILVANREETYTRPTIGLHFWMDHPDLLAGRDLKAGGTWLGLTRSGKIAGLTNHVFQNIDVGNDLHSRGELLTQYLNGDMAITDFTAKITETRHLYDGYRLIYGDINELHQYSNLSDEHEILSQGVHSLSNTNDDLSNHKLSRSKKLVEDYISSNEKLKTEQLIKLFQDQIPADKFTNIPKEIDASLAKKNSAIFAKDDYFGTVSTTVILIDRDYKVAMQETRYNQLAEVIEETKKTFILD